MAFIDVLKFRGPEDAIVWKWEPEAQRWGRRKEELRIGTQLVVNQSFIAVFVNGGQIADIFAPGTYTLTTKNLPILDRLISLPFGGDSPFKAEVYYINKAVVMDTKFNLPSFNMLDPNFKVPIPLTCSGSFAIRVGEARQFLTKVFGNLDVFTANRLKEYFRGIITENIKVAIGKIARAQKIGPMELESAVGDVSELILPVITATLEKYGVHLEMLNIESISIINDDPRVAKIVDEYQRIMSDDLAERLRLKRRGENIDVYRTERTFDTTEAAANNLGESGGSGNGIVGTVVGLGMAQPIAGAMANVMQGALNQIPLGQNPYPQPSQVPQQPAHNVTQSRENIMQTIRDLDELHKAGILTDEEFAAKKQELLSKI